MANHEAPRTKPQPAFEKHISSTLAPTTSISTNFVTTSPRPSSVSSHSFSRAPSISHSAITTKMRALWTTSHTKLLNNLNINLKKNTPPNPSLPCNQNPPSSSPNGLPEKCSYTYPSDPLSGPTTRHAEYLFSRVNKALLIPDCYITPPPSSPLSFPLSESPLSCSFSSVAPLEYKRRKNIIMHETDIDNNADTRTETKTKQPPPYAWETLQKSCKEILDNINTHFNVHTHTNLNANLKTSKWNERITGQENGTRPPMYVGIEDGGGYDVSTSRRGCDGKQIHDVNNNKLIRTISQESIVEVLFDFDEYSSSTYPLPLTVPPHPSNSTSLQNQTQKQRQKQNNPNKGLTQEIQLPMLLSRPPAYLSDIQSYGPKYNSSSTSKNKGESTERARISKEVEVEDVVNLWVHDTHAHGKLHKQGGRNGYEGVNGKMARGGLVRDFAYKEMRPKFRVGTDALDKYPIEGVVMVDQGKGGGERGGDDDHRSRYAKSELDLEDENGGEIMESEVERWVSGKLEKMDMNASTSTSTYKNPHRNSNPSQRSSPIPCPNPHSHPQTHPSHQFPTSHALIHLSRPPRATPQNITQSTSPLSLSLSLTPSIMDSTYLRGSEIQDHLLGYSGSLGESFFTPEDTITASRHEIEGDISRARSKISMRVNRGMKMKMETDELEDIGMSLNCTKDNTEGRERGTGISPGSPIEMETEREAEDTTEGESAIRFQLSPYTFPGTDLYLYEPISISTSKPVPTSSSESQAQSPSRPPHSNNIPTNHPQYPPHPHNSNNQSQTGTGYASKYPWGHESQEAKEYEGYEYAGGNQEMKSIMMHFSRSPTGFEGFDGGGGW